LKLIVYAKGKRILNAQTEIQAIQNHILEPFQKNSKYEQVSDLNLLEFFFAFLLG